MKRKHKLLLGTIALTLVTAPGCGFFLPNKGAVIVSLHTPPARESLHAQVIPSNTRLVVVSIDGTGLLAPLENQFQLQEGQATASQIVRFNDVPAGDKVVTATAFSDNQQQNSIARGTKSFQVVGGQTVKVVVEMTALVPTPTPQPSVSPTPTPTPTVTPQPSASPTPTPTPMQTVSGVSGASGATGGTGQNGQQTAGGGGNGL